MRHCSSLASIRRKKLWCCAGLGEWPSGNVVGYARRTVAVSSLFIYLRRTRDAALNESD
jgi:hypothetical protein